MEDYHGLKCYNASEPYLCSDKGLLLPLMDERNWSIALRSTLYMAGLIYCFLGIAIVADLFMCSIEVITSKKIRVKISPNEYLDVAGSEEGARRDVTAAAMAAEGDDEGSEDGGGLYREVLIWNPTVANLTLMALGSSAPEILLSIIEICGNGFEAGDLGPGTIVGSAAFNLLGITSVCMLCLPLGETRRIDQIYVFICTASFSIFAYLWLFTVLVLISPDVVEVWEGFLTFFMFVALVVVAYMIDAGIFAKCKSGLRKRSKSPLENGLFSNDEKAKNRAWKRIRQQVEQEHPDANVKEVAMIVAQKLAAEEPKNRLYYRIAATRSMCAMQKPAEKEAIEHTHEGVLATADAAAAVSHSRQSIPGATTAATVAAAEAAATLYKSYGRYGFVEFAAKAYAFSPDNKYVKLKIIRRGRLHKKVLVRYETVNGSAKKNEAFLPKSETVHFAPRESEKTIIIDLIHSYQWAEDESGFFVKLTLEDADEKTKIGRCHPAVVRFNNNTAAETVLEFRGRNHSCKESDGVVRIPVIRSGDTTGTVAVKYDTTDVEATEGLDYVGGPGELVFEPMEMLKYVDIVIIDDEEEEDAETFIVTLQEARGENVRIGNRYNAIVTIISDETVKERVKQLHRLVPMMLKGFEPGRKTWTEQLIVATSVNGGDTSEATMGDLITHILTFPWKVICAIIPPPSFCGGYLSFLLSLGMIGILTAIVGDLAGIFGCMTGLKDTVTAITLVAAGTSVPDLFASKIAAAADPNADNAIGNITGSNSVNVFLGLGLPWLLAAIYHQANGTVFVVEAGDLGFSVAVFTVTALSCLVLLGVRRKMAYFGNAELGGPLLPRVLSAAFLITMWFAYIILSSLGAYGYIETF